MELSILVLERILQESQLCVCVCARAHTRVSTQSFNGETEMSAHTGARQPNARPDSKSQTSQRSSRLHGLGV